MRAPDDELTFCANIPDPVREAVIELYNKTVRENDVIYDGARTPWIIRIKRLAMSKVWAELDSRRVRVGGDPDWRVKMGLSSDITRFAEESLLFASDHHEKLFYVFCLAVIPWGRNTLTRKEAEKNRDDLRKLANAVRGHSCRYWGRLSTAERIDDKLSLDEAADVLEKYAKRAEEELATGRWWIVQRKTDTEAREFCVMMSLFMCLFFGRPLFGVIAEIASLLFPKITKGMVQNWVKRARGE